MTYVVLCGCANSLVSLLSSLLGLLVLAGEVTANSPCCVGSVVCNGQPSALQWQPTVSLTLELLLSKLCVAACAVKVVGSSTDSGETTEGSESASGHCCRCGSVGSGWNEDLCDGDEVTVNCLQNLTSEGGAAVLKRGMQAASRNCRDTTSFLELPTARTSPSRTRSPG
jgi:hypothetical protein